MSKKLVNITAVTDSSTLAQTFNVSQEIDSANKAITGLKGGIYSRIRREARDVYEAHLKRVNGDAKQLVPEAMRAEFRMNMDAAESGDPDKRGKGTWGQNKTNLARALGLGFDFVAEPEVGANALANWCKEVDEQAQVEADAAAAAAYRKAHGLTDAKDTPSTGGDKAPAPAAPTASQGVSEQHTGGIVFKDAKQQAAFEQMLQLMAEISAKDPAELDGMINGAVQQLTAKQTKLLKLSIKAA